MTELQSSVLEMFTNDLLWNVLIVALTIMLRLVLKGLFNIFLAAST